MIYLYAYLCIMVITMVAIYFVNKLEKSLTGKIPMSTAFGLGVMWPVFWLTTSYVKIKDLDISKVIGNWYLSNKELL